MKKISSPTPHSIPIGTATTYSNITMEDIREMIEQLKAANIDRPTPVEVTEYDELHYRLSGGAYGIVRKDKWNEASMKAAESPL